MEEEKEQETEIAFETLKKEAEEYKHKYLHLLADSENTRKRLQKDRDEVVQHSMRSLLLEFLNPIDHMENALNYATQGSAEVKHWASGFEMILNQFKEVLTSNGVKPINAKGQPFDPHLHEAVEMIPTNAFPPGIVVEESAKGYVIGSKTLRPARVKVAKGPEEESEIAKDEEEE